ncbi:MAG: hypothetical protein ACWGSQ_13420 [Longimicrobiales bacterium]
MKKASWIALAVVLLSAPAPLRGQGLALAARAGTFGLGGEVAFGLSDGFVLRGGYGFFPFDYEDSYGGEDYTVEFPSSIWSAGIDIYLGGGPIRLMGGVMGRTGDVEMTSEWTGSREIGGIVYDVPGAISGVLEQSAIAPFAGIGFGKHTAGGFGFFLDVGAAYSGQADIEMSVSGDVALVPGIEEAVQAEADMVEEEIGGLLKFWPIVSLGIKVPLSIGY